MNINNLKIFLLLGQSNMAGRGDIINSNKEYNNVWILKPKQKEINKTYKYPLISNDFTWIKAKEPFFDDLVDIKTGYSLVCSFIDEYRKNINSDDPIGLVCFAIGGSPLSLWEPSGIMFKRTIEQCKLLQGEIKAILWHQGETDATDINLALSYSSRFENMINEYRLQLNNKDLLFICGEIGYFLEYNKRFPYYKDINTSIYNISKKLDHCYIVLSNNLEHKGDNLHFNTESLKELGKRYALLYKKAIE